VLAFADVDARKLARGVFDDVHAGGRRVPILHFRRVRARGIQHAAAVGFPPGCCSSRD
jgi:hypothetical protein